MSTRNVETPGEQIGLGVDTEDTASIDSITQPFDPSKIKVDREPMSIFQVMRKIGLEEIQLDPDFQRNLVWDHVRQSRLIESILLKIPLPAFYLDAVEPDKWVVVDGLQRLSTIKAFITDNSLRLRGLEFLSRLYEGKSFAELPRSVQRDIEETQLTLYIIRPETPPEVKFTIFYRINTGGMVLTAQEIRHATFPGRAPSLLRNIAESPPFQRATLGSVSSRRMDDRECVLRHLAFRLFSFESYSGDLNEFLGAAMNRINSASDAEVTRLESDFSLAMNTCRDVFRHLAFRKFDRRTGFRGPVNKALFESWSTAVLEFDQAELVSSAPAIVNKLEDALNNDVGYVKALSLATGSILAVKMRFGKAHQIIKEAVAS